MKIGRTVCIRKASRAEQVFGCGGVGGGLSVSASASTGGYFSLFAGGRWRRPDKASGNGASSTLNSRFSSSLRFRDLTGRSSVEDTRRFASEPSSSDINSSLPILGRRVQAGN
jgi:hypothetical protein